MAWRSDLVYNDCGVAGYNAPGGGEPSTPDSVVYAYDNAGNLASVNDLLGQQTSFTYTYRDERLRMQYPANIVDSVGYDVDGRRVYNRVVNGAQMTAFDPYTVPVLRAQVLTYDLAGRATFAGDSLGGRDTTHGYYSALGQLVDRDYALPAVSAMGNPARLYGAEVFWLDALGNRIKDSTNGNATSMMPLGGSTGSHSAARGFYAFDGSTTHAGRLEWASYEEFGNMDSTVYDPAGRSVYSFPVWTYAVGHTLDGRASYYGADGRLRVSEHRMVSSNTQVTQQNTWPWQQWFEEYRYDPLGRRVLVRTRRNCNVTNPSACNRGEIRRIVWDGNQVLEEVRMPGRDTDSQYFENDTALVRYPASGFPSYTDYNPQYGRTAYTHALGIDQPLAVTRMNYVDTVWNQPGYDRYNDFNVYPLWDWRGHADFGTVTDGGADACWSAARCATLKWKHQAYAFVSGSQSDTLAGWFGQLLVDNADGSGLLYRRNRYLDASTGRFTQEDPTGLAGGLNAYGFASGDPVNYSDPFGLCPNPLATGLGSLQCAIEDVIGAIKAGPGMLAEAILKPSDKRDLVVGLAMAPFGVAGVGEGGGAAATVMGTKAVVRGGIAGLGLAEKVVSGVRGVLSSGRADQVMVQATSDGGATVLRWVKGNNAVSSAMYHYVIDNTGKVVGAAKHAYDKAGAIAGTLKPY